MLNPHFRQVVGKLFACFPVEFFADIIHIHEQVIFCNPLQGKVGILQVFMYIIKNLLGHGAVLYGNQPCLYDIL